MKQMHFIFAGLIFAIFALFATSQFISQTKKKTVIHSFEECVKAGFPVMESYPEQCAAPGGPSFTRIFTEAECKAMTPETCLGSCVVCPPCPECSSISCQTEEFCKNFGIDRNWYKQIQQSRQSEESQRANPASEYCIDQGGALEMRSASDSSQIGYCIFPGGKECEEWQFFRNECEAK